MRGLSRLGWIRLASPLAGEALIGVLALADRLWPDLRPGAAPPSPSVQAPAPAAAGWLHSLGQRPEILRLGLERQTRLPCHEAFEVLHSDVARVPVWSVQRLDAGTLAQARAVVREDVFRVELQLPVGERAGLSDDARSSFERGHLAPAADMPTVISQVESSSPANMVQQVPAHHRGLWARIESATRGQAQRAGTLYVLTGIAALEERPAFVGGRLLVSSRLFKAVFKPRSGGAAVWWLPNAATEAYEVVSLDALEARTGLRVFPAVVGPARARANLREDRPLRALVGDLLVLRARPRRPGARRSPLDLCVLRRASRPRRGCEPQHPSLGSREPAAARHAGCEARGEWSSGRTPDPKGKGPATELRSTKREYGRATGSRVLWINSTMPQGNIGSASVGGDAGRRRRGCLPPSGAGRPERFVLGSSWRQEGPGLELGGDLTLDGMMAARASVAPRDLSSLGGRWSDLQARFAAATVLSEAALVSASLEIWDLGGLAAWLSAEGAGIRRWAETESLGAPWGMLEADRALRSAVVDFVRAPGGRTPAFSATPPRPPTMEDLGRRAPLLRLGAGAGPLGLGAQIR